MKRKLMIAGICVAALLFSQNAIAQTSANANAVQSQTIDVGGPSIASGTANAEQGQVQYQSSSGGSVGNSGNSSIGIQNSFNSGQPIRYLPVPGVMPIENYQGTFFGGPDYRDKGPHFLSMVALIGAMNHVDLDADVEGERHIKIIKQMMVPLADDSELSDETQEMIVVKFELSDGQAVNGGFRPVAALTVEAEKPDKSNSASLAMAIGKEARKLGCSRVIFLTEGSSKQLHSSGWGIGLSYSAAEVNSDPNGNGSVGSGGFGYSQGKAGYRDKVYLSALIGN